MTIMANSSAQHAPVTEPSASTSSVSGAHQSPLQSPTESDASVPSGRAIDETHERDWLELQQIPTQHDNELDDLSSGSISSGEFRVTTRRTVSRSSSSRQPRKGVWGSIQRFWAKNVSPTVPQKSNRDHFGTYFSWNWMNLFSRSILSLQNRRNGMQQHKKRSKANST
jgi:hypothetical protein